MTVNRKLKNLYSMYRFVGWQVFETFNEYEIARKTKNLVMFDITDKKLNTLVQKYEMLKQILIER